MIHNLIKSLHNLLLDFSKIFFLFPFFNKRRVYFGKKSYDLFIDTSYFSNKFKYKTFVLQFWRFLIHVAASIVLSSLIIFIFPKSTSLFFASLALVIFIQEFYFHPKYLNQPYKKSVTDFISWVLPAYWVLFY